jgi:hypothetical protein
MKLWKVWSVFGVGTASLVAALSYQTVGCSSSPSDAGAVGLPPSPPASPTPATSNVETFAIQKLLLGEADRTGAPSNTAWKSYGYNLDGVVTTKDSTDVCTLHTGAPKSNQADGNNGIDNAFGSVILPIIETAASLPTPSDTISQAIAKGDFTIQIQVKGLDDANAAQNSTGLTGQLFASGAYGGSAPPAFDSTTDWPVSGLLLNNPTDINSGSKIVFNQAYITDGTFVSGDLATGGVQVSISLVFQGVPLTLSVNHAVITFDHKTANGASNGTIAGVIDTEQLITGLQSVAGRISASLCGSAFNGIADQIRQASDIIKDGSNKQGVPCDGISIGLGFEAVKVANPTKIASDDGAVPPDPCTAGDGGTTTDSGSDSSTTTDAASDATTD